MSDREEEIKRMSYWFKLYEIPVSLNEAGAIFHLETLVGLSINDQLEVVSTMLDDHDPDYKAVAMSRVRFMVDKAIQFRCIRTRRGSGGLNHLSIDVEMNDVDSTEFRLRYSGVTTTLEDAYHHKDDIVTILGHTTNPNVPLEIQKSDIM